MQKKAKRLQHLEALFEIFSCYGINKYSSPQSVTVNNNRFNQDYNISLKKKGGRSC